MKIFFLFYLVCCTFLQTTFAAIDISKKELSQIQSDVRSIIKAFERSDVNTIFNKAHPKLMNLVGGEFALRFFIQLKMVEMKKQNLKYISHELGSPEKIYSDGESDFLFIPHEALFRAKGEKTEECWIYDRNPKKEGGRLEIYRRFSAER